MGCFDGGTITSDAGVLLLREIDRARNFFNAFSSCFVDYRDPRFVEHSVKEMVVQRTIGICLGYEDLIDHEELRRDPLLATVCGKLDPTGAKRRNDRDRGIPLAGKSTLNRLETFGIGKPKNQKYKKIGYSEQDIDQFFVDMFVKSHLRPPTEIILDVDATDDPLHGHQEGRFFHGYYDCYCYLPLYIFCADQLLYAKLKTANLDPGNESLPVIKTLVQRIRRHWPHVRIVFRGDSGFCREELMSWCEQNGIFFVFGLARTTRLLKRIIKELKKVRKRYHETYQPQRIYKDFTYRTLDSWSRSR